MTETAADDPQWFAPVARVRAEIPRIKRSRFVATLFPCRREDDVIGCVQAVKEEWPDARHHCFAFRLGPRGQRYRFDDDGEPSGSAGRPILQQLDGRNATRLVVVVTRWFGGVKLGVGGLVRAYGAAAAAALDRAALAPVRTWLRAQLELPYECEGRVRASLETFEARIVGQSHEARVRLELELPEKAREPFRTSVLDATQGRTEVKFERIRDDD